MGRSQTEKTMNSPNEKPGQSTDQLEQQIREQAERDKAGQAPGVDKDDAPQGGPMGNEPRQA
jgi:hypothetical protein